MSFAAPSPTEPSRLAAVLFDLDGTLVDSVPGLRRGYFRFVEAIGGRGSDEEFARLTGPPLPVVIARLRETYALAEPDDVLLARYLDIIHDEYVRAELVPGALALLDSLDARGVATAVVTSAPGALARSLLAARGVLTRFGTVVCGDEVPRGKPHPDGYLAALERLGVAAARAVAVEDTRTGARAATAAGLRCLGVVPEDRRVAMGLAGACAVADTLAGISAIIDALHAGCGRVLAARRIEVIERHDLPPLDADTAARVDLAWDAARRERPSLHDGRLLSVIDLRETPREASSEAEGGVDRALVVEVAEVPYRWFVAQRGGVPLGVRALGVSGATRLPSGRLVLGRRALDVTQHPGAWELVPSGGVTPDSRGAGGAIDPLAQLLEELSEEIGLGPARVESASALGLVEDLDDRVIDLCYRLELRADEAEVRAAARGRAEYPEIGFAERTRHGWTSDPPPALAGPPESRVPTVDAILALLVAADRTT